VELALDKGSEENKLDEAKGGRGLRSRASATRVLLVVHQATQLIIPEIWGDVRRGVVRCGGSCKKESLKTSRK